VIVIFFVGIAAALGIAAIGNYFVGRVAAILVKRIPSRVPFVLRYLIVSVCVIVAVALYLAIIALAVEGLMFVFSPTDFGEQARGVVMALGLAVCLYTFIRGVRSV
jgi:hypothetical protein